MKPLKSVGFNAAMVAAFSALVAKGYMGLIAIVATVFVAMVIVGGLAWVISDAKRTGRLTRIIDACRGGRTLRIRVSPRTARPINGRAGRTRGRSRRGTRS